MKFIFIILYVLINSLTLNGVSHKQFLNTPDNMIQYDMAFINKYDDSRPPEELPEEEEKKWVNNNVDPDTKKKFFWE